jgi:hypothetical protein
MGSEARYSIDVRYAPLELVDAQALVDACKESYVVEGSHMPGDRGSCAFRLHR